jgi:hypothetical protein
MIRFLTPPVAVETVSSVAPTRGPTSGNSVVSVVGTFTAGISTTCLFGTSVVSGTVTGGTATTCVTPPHATGVVSLSIANNGQNYSPTSAFYTFYRTIRWG